MNNRVKELRKHLLITQAEFAEKIGITNSALSRIESGANILTEQNIKSIVREFGVSESWLRTGEGEMYPPKTRMEEIAAFFSDLRLDADDSFRVRLIAALADLDENEWQLLAKIASRMVDEKGKSPDK